MVENEWGDGLEYMFSFSWGEAMVVSSIHEAVLDRCPDDPSRHMPLALRPSFSHPTA